MSKGRFAKTGRVTPGSTEHLLLLAARASGRIESSAIAERLGYYPATAVSQLCRAGLLAREGLKDVVLILTPAGRQSCPDRRAIPVRLYQP